MAATPARRSTWSRNREPAEFHGSLYWYKRHEQFNANDFFNNRDGLPKPIFRYNTLGGTIGGPIYIPRNGTSTRRRHSSSIPGKIGVAKEPLAIGRRTTPTALERQGDFSQTLDQNNRLIVIRDPTTGSAFPGNIIPKSRISPNGQAMLNLLPMPNVTDRSITGGSYNYQFQEIRDKPKNTNLIKLDFMPALEGHHHDSRQKLLVRRAILGRHGGGEFQLAAVSASLPVHRGQRQGGLDARDQPERRSTNSALGSGTWVSAATVDIRARKASVRWCGPLTA